MFEGYLTFGGNEIVNSARALGYTTTADCPVGWLVCKPCDGVHDAVDGGQLPYQYQHIAEAPWYDEQDEATHRFMGVHALAIEGITDSTRTAEVAEGILDGGVVGLVRNATRRVRVRAILTAEGEDALEAGMSWLEVALRPRQCGIHGSTCGSADASFFVACPPTRGEATGSETVWSGIIVTNLVTNPSFEGATIPAGATVSTEWSMGSGRSLYIAGSGFGHGAFGHGPFGH